MKDDRKSEYEDLLTKAEFDVVSERHRQISDEGWDPETDDKWRNGQLAMGAAAYTLATTVGPEKAVEIWPWQLNGWKPKDARRNLVRAGALIVAEIERLDRQDASARQREAEREKAKAQRGRI